VKGLLLQSNQPAPFGLTPGQRTLQVPPLLDIL